MNETVLSVRNLKAWFDSSQLGVTDPEIERRYVQKDEGEYLLRSGSICLTISLGEPFHGFVYKLVAGVLTAQDET